jgi:hypothetical protein
MGALLESLFVTAKADALTDYSYHSALAVVRSEMFELPTPCFVVMRSGLDSARIGPHPREPQAISLAPKAQPS